eukprot:TRINITY_DN11741_c0_g1_i1.p2 TRINITY_DN11741_c0_g1~~TRINITY_DN11741_c0_g1_i1.p2  ORF type:complete len:69 (+),score=12.18 TRINITY_DN11741_c0_g1_i1:112-318(+)
MSPKQPPYLFTKTAVAPSMDWNLNFIAACAMLAAKYTTYVLSHAPQVPLCEVKDYISDFLKHFDNFQD